jgi:hypothetical protein
MNHNVTVAIAAIIAAMTLTAVAFVIPQQALAHKHHNHSDKNSLKLNQQTSQANVCTGAAPADGEDDGHS